MIFPKYMSSFRYYSSLSSLSSIYLCTMTYAYIQNSANSPSSLWSHLWSASTIAPYRRRTKYLFFDTKYGLGTTYAILFIFMMSSTSCRLSSSYTRMDSCTTSRNAQSASLFICCTNRHRLMVSTYTTSSTADTLFGGSIWERVYTVSQNNFFYKNTYKDAWI